MTLILAAITGKALISIVAVALILVVLYYVVSLFIQGKVLTVIGLLLGLILLFYALHELGLFDGF